MVTELRNAFAQPDGGPALDLLASRIKASKKRPVVRLIRLCQRPIDDDDNLSSSVRYLLNAIKRSRLILDDSRKEIRLKVTQEKVKTRKERGTRIEIEYP